MPGTTTWPLLSVVCGNPSSVAPFMAIVTIAPGSPAVRPGCVTVNVTAAPSLGDAGEATPRRLRGGGRTVKLARPGSKPAFVAVIAYAPAWTLGTTTWPVVPVVCGNPPSVAPSFVIVTVTPGSPEVAPICFAVMVPASPSWGKAGEMETLKPVNTVTVAVVGASSA